MSVLVVFGALLIIGAVGFAWRNATVSKLHGLKVEQTIVATTNTLGLVRRTVAFEPGLERFERTHQIYVFLVKTFPGPIIRVYQAFPSLHWRLGLGPKPLQLDTHEMEWSSGSSSGGYLYARAPHSDNARWEFVHWNAMNIDEITSEIVRRSFGDGPKQLETVTVAAGQIVFARLSIKPETIYILRVHESRLHKAIVDYTSVPTWATWPLGASSGAEGAICIGNLRKLGAHAAVFAEANGGMMPSNFAQIHSASPDSLQLDCPGQLPDGMVINFGPLEHESSYAIIAPGIDSRRPENLGRVYAGCLKHGFVCLTDGSANSCQEPRDEFMTQYSILLGRPSLTNSEAK